MTCQSTCAWRFLLRTCTDCGTHLPPSPHPPLPSPFCSVRLPEGGADRARLADELRRVDTSLEAALAQWRAAHEDAPHGIGGDVGSSVNGNSSTTGSMVDTDASSSGSLPVSGANDTRPGSSAMAPGEGAVGLGPPLAAPLSEATLALIRVTLPASPIADISIPPGAVAEPPAGCGTSSGTATPPSTQEPVPAWHTQNGNTICLGRSPPELPDTTSPTPGLRTSQAVLSPAGGAGDTVGPLPPTPGSGSLGSNGPVTTYDVSPPPLRVTSPSHSDQPPASTPSPTAAAQQPPAEQAQPPEVHARPPQGRPVRPCIPRLVLPSVPLGLPPTRAPTSPPSPPLPPPPPQLQSTSPPARHTHARRLSAPADEAAPSAPGAGGAARVRRPSDAAEAACTRESPPARHPTGSGSGANACADSGAAWGASAVPHSAPRSVHGLVHGSARVAPLATEPEEAHTEVGPPPPATISESGERFACPTIVSSGPTLLRLLFALPWLPSLDLSSPTGGAAPWMLRWSRGRGGRRSREEDGTKGRRKEPRHVA